MVDTAAAVLNPFQYSLVYLQITKFSVCSQVTFWMGFWNPMGFSNLIQILVVLSTDEVLVIPLCSFSVYQ